MPGARRVAGWREVRAPQPPAEEQQEREHHDWCGPTTEQQRTQARSFRQGVRGRHAPDRPGHQRPGGSQSDTQGHATRKAAETETGTRGKTGSGGNGEPKTGPEHEPRRQRPQDRRQNRQRAPATTEPTPNAAGPNDRPDRRHTTRQPQAWPGEHQDQTDHRRVQNFLMATICPDAPKCLRPRSQKGIRPRNPRPRCRHLILPADTPVLR